MIVRVSRSLLPILLLSGWILWFGCEPKDDPDTDPEEIVQILPPYSLDEFVMGVDLSYLNQILDQGGSYADQQDPYVLFSEMGANLGRLRLWHSPDWVRDLYPDHNGIFYSGYADVMLAASRIQSQGMAYCLDIHYSDNWADPGKQQTPKAWQGLDLAVLTDSVYDYTSRVLTDLRNAGLSPAFVQLGNEINSGLLHPVGHYQEDSWKNTGQLINAGIRAVRDVFENDTAPEIILHIAQPENIRWFFEHLTIAGGVTDFEIIGVSYYAPWSEVDLPSLAGYLRTAINQFDKELMIMETAFPWTTQGADAYPNILGGSDSLSGYPVSRQGQLDYMKDLCQITIDAGGRGVVYWEPGWISSALITQWGRGSAWENCTFFDFTNAQALLPVVEYLSFEYEFK